MGGPAERQVVLFSVGHDQFAVDILEIREIARFQPLRRIPKAPDFLAGVIDLRGSEIVPIIDMHNRLELEAAVDQAKSRIIIAPIDGRPVGFLVDVVRDVITIPSTEVEAPPAVGSTPGFLEGVIRVTKSKAIDKGRNTGKDTAGLDSAHKEIEILLLVNIGQILSNDERIHMEELRRSLVHDAAKAKPEAPKAVPKVAAPGKGKAAPGKDGPKRKGSDRS